MLGMLSQGRAPARGGTDPDAAVARRVGWRLAALTVGLIAALLLVLGVAVYGTMQHVLLQSLQDTVQQRTTGFLTLGIQSGRLPGPPGGPGRPPPFRRPRRSTIGDVRFTIANQRLHVLPGADPDAPTTLPDPAAAHLVLGGHASPRWSTRQVDSTGPYLIYTLPVQLVQPDGSAAPGVLQASISEQQ
ncbi:MAG TPA: hypothetical protein VJY65_04700, partial [Chloroflexota bacterium]|nr:hypothetical protein [Chloroflexota bacterium]